jgi:hypothetical protein
MGLAGTGDEIVLLDATRLIARYHPYPKKHDCSHAPAGITAVRAGPCLTYGGGFRIKGPPFLDVDIVTLHHTPVPVW